MLPISSTCTKDVICLLNSIGNTIHNNPSKSLFSFEVFFDDNINDDEDKALCSNWWLSGCTIHKYFSFCNFKSLSLSVILLTTRKNICLVSNIYTYNSLARSIIIS